MHESSKRPSPPLTALQQQWLNHLRAAAQQKLSMTEYARSQQLDPGALYRWHAVLKKRGVAIGAASSGEFVRASVVPASAPVPLRIVLRNGIVIEVPANALPLSSLVSALS